VKPPIAGGAERVMRVLAVFALVVLLWLAGLWAFAERVAASTPAVEPPTADGIVALTGSSSIRLEAATQLLEDGKAQRLLISGVNRQATRSEVKGVARGVGRIWDCCVDLGFQAETTQGNAVETAGWAREHGYHSLIVVTADYHMPRALLELRGALPDVALYPYPVVTDTLNARRWWARNEDIHRMVVEYSKYLVILAKDGISRLITPAPKPKPAAHPAP
jgi:uncharacterized SAM-binding protein YcdF (DUF218 family)